MRNTKLVICLIAASIVLFALIPAVWRPTSIGDRKALSMVRLKGAWNSMQDIDWSAELNRDVVVKSIRMSLPEVDPLTREPFIIVPDIISIMKSSPQIKKRSEIIFSRHSLDAHGHSALFAD